MKGEVGGVGGVGGVAGAWTSVIAWQEMEPCRKPEIYCCQSLTQEALSFLLVLLKIGWEEPRLSGCGVDLPVQKPSPSRLN